MAGRMRRLLAHRNALLLLALAAIGGVFQYFTRESAHGFLSIRSLSTVLTQASVIGVLACGMTFIIILRHIDLSVGSALAFLGALTAVLMAPPAQVSSSGADSLALADAVPSGFGLPAVGAAAAVLGVALILWTLKGLIQSWTRMPAFIITLGGMMAYRGLAYLIARREIPIADDTFIAHLGTGSLPIGSIAVAWVTLVWAVTALLMHVIAARTVFGRHLYAVGSNMETARLCGVAVGRVSLIAFTLMGLFTALASLMYLGQQGTAESSAGQLAELDAIAACVIGGVSLQGGRGTIGGAVLGTLIMQCLTSGLYQCNVETGYQMLIKALVLVGVVALDHCFRRRQAG